MKTKALIIGISILAASFNLALAQISVTATAGNYVSKTSFNGIDNTVIPRINPLSGFAAGVQVSVPMDQKLSFKTGLDYKRKGFETYAGTSLKIGGMDIPIGVKAINRIEYIELPLMLSYKMPELGTIQPYISLGPSIAYAKSAELITRASAIIDINLSRTDLDLAGSDFNRTEISANMAVGAEFPYKTGFFLAEFAYDKALTNFSSDQSTINIGVNHSGYGLKVGYGMKF